MTPNDITVTVTPEQTGRVFGAAGEACAMLEAILSIAGPDWTTRNRGVPRTWKRLRAALRAAGVPEEGMTFSPIARKYRRPGKKVKYAQTAQSEEK